MSFEDHIHRELDRALAAMRAHVEAELRSFAQSVAQLTSEDRLRPLRTHVGRLSMTSGGRRDEARSCDACAAVLGIVARHAGKVLEAMMVQQAVTLAAGAGGLARGVDV